MKPKDASVNLTDLHPEVLAAQAIIERTFKEALHWCINQEPIATSGAEGTPDNGVHSAKSLHYPANCPGGLGLALDLRTRDVGERWAFLLDQELGPGWDVIYEKDHIHIERDYKKKPLQDPTGGSTISGGPPKT